MGYVLLCGKPAGVEFPTLGLPCVRYFDIAKNLAEISRRPEAEILEDLPDLILSDVHSKARALLLDQRSLMLDAPYSLRTHRTLARLSMGPGFAMAIVWPGTLKDPILASEGFVEVFHANSEEIPFAEISRHLERPRPRRVFHGRTG